MLGGMTDFRCCFGSAALCTITILHNHYFSWIRQGASVMYCSHSGDRPTAESAHTKIDAHLLTNVGAALPMHALTSTKVRLRQNNPQLLKCLLPKCLAKRREVLGHLNKRVPHLSRSRPPRAVCSFRDIQPGHTVDLRCSVQ